MSLRFTEITKRRLAAVLLAVGTISALAAAPTATQAATTAPLYYVLPTTSQLSGTVGSPFAQGFQVLGGGTRPITWSITSGSLPSGLTLIKNWGNSSTMISGTPTKVQTNTFTLLAKDRSGNSLRKSFTIVISAASAPRFTAIDSALASGEVGVDYSWSLYTSGGTMPYTFSIISGALPPGLTLTSNGGAIFGVPTTRGIYSFTATVVDANGLQASRTFTITIT
jgi:large repetitive protein